MGCREFVVTAIRSRTISRLESYSSHFCHIYNITLQPSSVSYICNIFSSFFFLAYAKKSQRMLTLRRTFSYWQTDKNALLFRSDLHPPYRVSWPQVQIIIIFFLVNQTVSHNTHKLSNVIHFGLLVFRNPKLDFVQSVVRCSHIKRCSRFFPRLQYRFDISEYRIAVFLRLGSPAGGQILAPVHFPLGLDINYVAHPLRHTHFVTRHELLRLVQGSIRH